MNNILNFIQSKPLATEVPREPELPDVDQLANGTSVKTFERDELTKQLLLQFLQLQMEAETEFVVALGEGEKIIQRMRVRMSRLRNKAKAAKLRMQFFQMRVVSMHHGWKDTTGAEWDRFVLRKESKRITQIDTLMSDEDMRYIAHMNDKI